MNGDVFFVGVCFCRTLRDHILLMSQPADGVARDCRNYLLQRVVAVPRSSGKLPTVSALQCNLSVVRPSFDHAEAMPQLVHRAKPYASGTRRV
jgi:hypothetical protein